MKKYIFIVTLLLGNIAWSMHHEKHSSKTDNPNVLEAMILSSQKDITNKKEGLEIMNEMLKNSGVIPKAEPVSRSFSPSPLFLFTLNNPPRLYLFMNMIAHLHLFLSLKMTTNTLILLHIPPSLNITANTLNQHLFLLFKQILK